MMIEVLLGQYGLRAPALKGASWMRNMIERMNDPTRVGFRFEKNEVVDSSC
jgi:hypothetical protein